MQKYTYKAMFQNRGFGKINICDLSYVEDGISVGEERMDSSTNGVWNHLLEIQKK